MKKHILLLFLLLGVAWSALAVPAMPGKYRRVQPDGSVIVLENHGDEYCHWITDEKGRVVEKGPDGFYRRKAVEPLAITAASLGRLLKAESTPTDASLR